MKREQRADWIDALAPPAPPCFETRLQWLEYLRACCEAQALGCLGAGLAPLLFQPGAAPTFNRHMSFCDDCGQPFAGSMKAQGRCHPDWLTRDVEQEAMPCSK